MFLSYLCFQISFNFSFKKMRVTSDAFGVSKSFFHTHQGGSLGVPQGRNVFLSYLCFQISFHFSSKIMRVTSYTFGVSTSFFDTPQGGSLGAPQGRNVFFHIEVSEFHLIFHLK